jgi:hypothetical protein
MSAPPKTLAPWTWIVPALALAALGATTFMAPAFPS